MSPKLPRFWFGRNRERDREKEMLAQSLRKAGSKLRGRAGPRLLFGQDEEDPDRAVSVRMPKERPKEEGE